MWGAVQIKPNCRKIACANLERQGFAIFAPSETRVMRRGRQNITRHQLLFPGYIFVQFDIDIDDWQAIGHSYGVNKLVRKADGIPAGVPEPFIAVLQQHCDGEGVLIGQKRVKPGDLVEIKSGPFADFVSRVENVEPGQRIWLLLDIMGKNTRVKLMQDDVRLLDNSQR